MTLNESTLQQEVDALKTTVAGAKAHPFVPKPAAEAMDRAAVVLSTLIAEVVELRARVKALESAPAVSKAKPATARAK